MSKVKPQIKSELIQAPVVIDAHAHVGSSFKAYVQGEYPYCLSFEDLVLRMDCLGIAKSCVFPFPNSCFYEVDKTPQATLHTTEKYTGCPYELENQNLLHEIFTVFPEYSHRALPFLMFDPSRRVPEQVETMKGLAVQYPIFGLKTCTHQIKAYIKDLLGKGSAIIAFARQANLPVLCHSSYDPGDLWANVYDILDVVEQNPEVRFCVAHTARFANDALERAAALPNCFVDLSAFSIHCLLARQNSPAVPDEGKRFKADYHQPQAVMQALVERFPQKLIWGSDTPFNYCFTTMVNAKGDLVTKALKSAHDDEYSLLAGLSEMDIRRISYTNTMTFLFGNEAQEE